MGIVIGIKKYYFIQEERFQIKCFILNYCFLKPQLFKENFIKLFFFNSEKISSSSSFHVLFLNCRFRLLIQKNGFSF